MCLITLCDDNGLDAKSTDVYSSNSIKYFQKVSAQAKTLLDNPQPEGFLENKYLMGKRLTVLQRLII